MGQGPNRERVDDMYGWWLVGALWFSSAVTLWGDDSAGRYFLGVAKRDISPREPVLLSGYAGRDHQLTQQWVEPLYGRAVAIGPDRNGESPDDPGPVLLIAVDNCAVHAAVRRMVCREISDRFGVAPAAITVTSTHTHSGPMLSGALANLLIRDLSPAEEVACDRYTQQLVEQLVEVAGMALERRQWVTLERNVGQANFAINRRGGGVVDHQLPLLVAYDPSGQPVLALTNYACHCVAAGSGLEICGDWAGFAAAAIDAANEGLTAVVLIGCGADQNPAQMGSMAAARHQGQQLAAEVQALLEAPKQPVQGPLRTQFAEIELPLEPLPTIRQWEAKSQQGGIVGYHAAKNLRRLAAGESLPTSVTYPVQSWSFGQDLAMAFLGGEVVVDYVHLLRRRLDPARLWVTAYANDVACYIPSERVWREGGYEGGDAMVWYDLPTRLAAGVEDLVVQEVVRQLAPDFATQQDPARTGGTWPKSPLEAWQSLRTPEDLVVELVASEPLVEDPVAIDFGPDGALWVAQMADYPEGLDGHYLPGGSIRTLRDTTGDGQYDSAVTFLSNLPFPTDVKVWRDGVLICSAPDVLFARDTTGDGRADEVTKLLTGFETHNYQARVNSLVWGLDHWVYGAAGIFGGQVRDGAGIETDLSNRDFRWAPDQGWVEAVSGRTQQGRARDDWGNWFGCDNGTLLYHYPNLDHEHRDRVAGPTPPPAVSVARSSRLFPAGNTVQWALSGPPGVPTSACGMTILRSDLLGAEFVDSALTCEPVNQLVHRMKLVPQGTTFVGHRGQGEAEREFMWSTDNWFRPVQAKTGLDGALYVVDMYRYLIEHPRFLPEEVRANLDVRAGQGLGRIYRVVPRQGETPPPAAPLDLNALAFPDLARQMDTTVGTLRDLVHQVLWWRFTDSRATTPEWEVGLEILRQLAADSPSAAVRIQTLALLDQWQALDMAGLQRALQDPDSRVRRHAVRLASHRLAASSMDRAPATDAGQLAAELPAVADWDRAWIGERLVALAQDDDPHVRLQVAFALGHWETDSGAEALSGLLDRDGDDPWISAAIYGSLQPRSLAVVLRKRLDRLAPEGSLPEALLQLTRQALRHRSASLLTEWSTRMEGAAEQERLPLWQLQLWSELAAAVVAAPAEWGAAGEEFVAGSSRRLESLGQQLSASLENAEDEEWCGAALRVLGWAADGVETPSPVVPWLSAALSPQQSVAVQQAALESLGRLAASGESAAVSAFFNGFAQLTPALQTRGLQVVQTYQPLSRQLLVEIAAGRQPSNVLDAAARQFLLEHPDPDIRRAAGETLGISQQGHWTTQFPEYRELDLSFGSAQRGRLVFRQHCAGCHQLHGEGHPVGPDLMALTDRSPAALLQAILDPNADLDTRYAAYTVLNLNGQVFHGLLLSESALSLTLAGQDGQQWQLLRSEVDEIRRTGKSLMPAGLGRDIPPAAMADLLAYLGAAATTANYRYVDGSGPHPIYADSDPPSKLVDGRFGSGRFDDGQWVSFYHAGRRRQQVEFDLGSERVVSQLRITYGVNHVPGVIHAPKFMEVRFRSADGVEVGTHVIDDWDNRPDGLGVYQISRRQKWSEFPPMSARFVELSWENEQEWSSLAEVEFQPVSDHMGSDVGSDPPAPADMGDSDMGEVAPVSRIRRLLSDVAIGTDDEYRVIPQVWSEAIAIGRRDSNAEILELLEASLPDPRAPLRDWQAVVIGGGVINGLSQVGHYPGDRVRTILAPRPDLIARFERSLILATEMADHEPTPTGTRYDALRMVALRPWSAIRPLLEKYLQPGTNHELQQGAVSGLVDVPEPVIIELLNGALDHLPTDLQELAIQGIVRPTARDRLDQALRAAAIPANQWHPLLRAKLQHE